MLAVHMAFDGFSGAPRVLADLRAVGEMVSRKTVAKLMRAQSIVIIRPITWHPVTTIADESADTLPDLVERDFDRGRLDAVWTSDITFLSTDQGVAMPMRDGCSWRLLGWAVNDNLRIGLVETGLCRMVTLRGGDTTGVIFHADDGCQHTSGQLAGVAAEFAVMNSVRRIEMYHNNAQIESFWSTLRNEHY